MKPIHKLREKLSKLKQLQPIDHSVVTTLYTLSVKSLITASIFTILISIFLYSELNYRITIWASVLVGFLLFRLYYAYLYKTDPHRYTIERWYKIFMVFAFITGVMVSMLGALFIHYLSDYHQMFILAALLGLTAGATTSLSSDFRIAIIYISIIMLPLIISMAMMKTSLAFILPILLILFYLSQILMIYNSYTQDKQIKELKIQQNLLHNLFSEAPLGMFSYDNNLNILDANKHLHTMFKEDNNHIVDMNLHSLPNAELLKAFTNVLTEGSQSYTGSCITPKGSHFWIEATAFPFKNAQNSVIGGIGIIEDKTKEYNDKKELESLHKSLQEQVEKNQLLLEQNKQFIADMVHQIRTPLTVIMTNTSLLEMQSELQTSSYIAQIHSAINMLSNAYEDLSYIISNDTIEYKPIEIDFSNFLHDRVLFFEVIAQANDKTIHTDITNNIYITMNDTELERLIDNNISNAIKHSYDKSNIEIVLEKNHSDVVLKFISQGSHINNVTKIFDRNHTETNTSKRSLGLGLNMVKNICEKNSIDFTAHSEKNLNTFTYVFNLED